MKAAGQWEDAVALYKNSVFFKTLVENAMMSMSKSFFPLTAYMQDDPEFGAFWNMIFEEFERTRDLLLELTGSKQLMEDAPVMRASIQMREQIVLPLLTIQQFALREIQKLRAAGAKEADLAVFEKMVTRSLFGNINAARNSA
jgi:phosphoenolpyruvate carboxylase